jgi:hypothetical protein
MPRGWLDNDGWYDDLTPTQGSVALLREMPAPRGKKQKKQKPRTIGFTLPKPKKRKLRER